MQIYYGPEWLNIFLLDYVSFNIFRVEDAFLTGHCASRAGGIQRVHNNIFSCGQLVNRSIKYTILTGHCASRVGGIQRVHNNMRCTNTDF